MILEILLGITTIISIVLSWTTYNQLQKVERLEDWAEEYSQKLIDTKTTMDLLDSEGKFESDDEIGTVFEGIKTIIDELNQLTKKDI